MKEWEKYAMFFDCELIKLMAENKQLRDALLRYRKMDRLSYFICGTCGKEYHTVNLFDCPWCEKNDEKEKEEKRNTHAQDEPETT